MVQSLSYRVGFEVDDRRLSELHARAFSYPEDAGPVTIDPWSQRLHQYSIAWVGAFDDTELVGFVHACTDGGRHAFVLDTVVDPRHRHRGVATRLVAELTAAVTAAGAEWLHVDYEPHLDAFYRSCGFRPTIAGLIHLTPSPVP